MQSLPSLCLQSKSRNRHPNNLQYNTVKCFRGGIDKVQWEFGSGGGGEEHLPGETRDSLRGGSCDLTSAQELAM